MNKDPHLVLFKELLGIAALEGSAGTVELLLRGSPKLAMAVKDGYDYPLHRAAEKGHTGTVALLHDHGAPIDGFNNMALRLAAKCGHADTVKFLLDHGADVTTASHQPVQDAFSIGRADILRMLLLAGGKLRTPVRRPLPQFQHIYSPEIQQVLTEFNLWFVEERGPLSRVMDAVTGREKHRPAPPILFPPPRP